MSQAESLNEAIGLLKVMLGLLVAVYISLIAWLAQNYAKTQAHLLIMAWAAALVATIAIIWVYVTACRRIKDRKDV
jgi:hypothetical protein